ncbi:MAG: cupin domain-containing protein [Pseudomonadota bacterium]
MELNADFSKRVVVKSETNEWVPSPMAGVERKMLDRIGDEVARATTIVRFAPGSAFSAHTHDGGEEFIVLDGVFQDEHGDFPTGSYIRNPPTSSHTPASEPGTTILVKLHQFDPKDRTHVRIATDKTEPVAAAGRVGVKVIPLYKDNREHVRIEDWAPGAEISMDVQDGLEVFVLRGGFTEAGDRLSEWDWLRLPKDSQLQAVAGPEGARVWIKSDHLAEMV